MNVLSALYNVIITPITQIIEIAYRVFDKMFGNTGLAVIGVSLTVTLLCLPLYIVAEQWEETERGVQARMKSGIARIKAYFKGDEQYMILNTFYRQNGYHPIMALRSSFGILIQIPFFLAAYHTLSELPDLMGKSFLFVKDMGQPDAVFKIGDFNVNILPIAMTLINLVSGFIYSKGHALREKVQILVMALVFLVVLYGSPAGLVIYWTMNNVFSLVKNVFYKMKHPVKVLYACMCAALIGLSLYIVFIYGGGASMKKRLLAAAALLIWLPIPVYLKAIDYFINNIITQLKDNFKLRTVLFFGSALALTILNGLVLPSGLVESSVQEFCIEGADLNPTYFFHSSFWMSFGLFVFWPGCIYFLFKEKIQSLLSFLYPSFLIGAVVNAFVFKGNYGSMDSSLILLDGFSNPSALFMLVNVIAVAAILAIVALIIKFKLTKWLSNIAFIGCFAFILMTMSNIHGWFGVQGINPQFEEFCQQEKAKAELNSLNTSNYRFHLSKDKQNVVIIMLDRFESSFVESIFKDQPQIKAQLADFTYYPNTLAFNGHTLMGSPGLYGGYEYTPYEMNQRPDETLKDKHNQALSLLPKMLSDQKGFECYLSDLSWANHRYISDMSFVNNEKYGLNKELVHGQTILSRYSADFKKEKLLPGNEGVSLKHVINRNLFWVSLFREVPSPLRSVVYYKGTWWESGIPESSSSFADWFACLYYLDKMTATDSERPTLSVITNECTHSSESIAMYDVQPDNTDYSVKNDKAYIIDTVAIKQVAEYCDWLKANDVYDNTRIIIVSDHGIGNRESKYTTGKINGYSKDHLNPVLLVKDFGSKNKEIKIDNSFMTNADVPSIALKGIIDNPVNPYTGKSITMDYKKDGVIATGGDIFMTDHSNSKNVYETNETKRQHKWFKVKDDIFQDANWEVLDIK